MNKRNGFLLDNAIFIYATKIERKLSALLNELT